MTGQNGEDAAVAGRDLVQSLRDLAAWAPDDPDEGFALAAEAADTIERLETLVIDLGLHLTALCDHPGNWEDRYNLPAGRPCPGCYDARDAFAAWGASSGGDAR